GPQARTRVETRPVQNFAPGVELCGDLVGKASSGAFDLCRLADLHFVTDMDRPDQLGVSTDGDLPVQRDRQLPALDDSTLAHGQHPGDEGQREHGPHTQARSAGETRTRIDLDHHSLTNLDTLSPGGAADQSHPAPGIQPIPEATLQTTTDPNTRS